jgi:hypothetical protein
MGEVGWILFTSTCLVEVKVDGTIYTLVSSNELK